MSRTGIALAILLALAWPAGAWAQEGSEPAPETGDPVVTVPVDPVPEPSSDEPAPSSDEPAPSKDDSAPPSDDPTPSSSEPAATSPERPGASPWFSFPPGVRAPVQHTTSGDSWSEPEEGPRCEPWLGPEGSPLGATFRCDFPDPMVLRVGTTYFAYGTSVKWSGVRHAFPILSSKDLRHWTPVGDVFAAAPSWAAGQLWAPSVLHVRGTYYLYYSALRRSDGNHCLAVATSSSPAGPFADDGVIRCQDRRERGFIDPAALVYRGRGYLFFSVDGPGHSIAALPLDRSLLRARGRTRRVLSVGPRERRLSVRTVEAPFPVRRGKRFYLFYSAGCWCSDYQTDWATASSPLGPYRRTSPRPLLAGGAGLVGPGGGSLVTRPDGSTVYAFHAWTGANNYDLHGVRTLRTAPIRWTRTGPTLAP